MKHLPNLLTLGNLFCGCIAVVYILTAQPYTSMTLPEHGGLPSWQWIQGAEQMYLGSFFIVFAAIFDLLDGLVARALKVFSPIGKDLDSLADVVSFGVAPSCILYQLLWDAAKGEKNAFDVSMITMAPAFLLACFAALRLAKFNVTASSQKTHFIGMPTPAAGLFVATFPLVLWFAPAGYAQLLNPVFRNVWAIYGIIAVLCWLMVSPIPFIKLMPSQWKIAAIWPQLILLVLAAVSVPFLGYMAAPLLFVAYVLLSLVYPAGRNERTDLN